MAERTPKDVKKWILVGWVLTIAALVLAFGNPGADADALALKRAAPAILLAGIGVLVWAKVGHWWRAG